VFGTVPALFLSGSASNDRTGWTVGGGLEWMFAPNWSVFAEYNYMDFGRENINFTAAPGTFGLPTTNSIRFADADGFGRRELQVQLRWPGRRQVLSYALS
jgi:opacity protein-like surface antigen